MNHIRENNIAYIDLSSGKTRKEEISLQLRRDYIGGMGINSKLLLDSGAISADALSEKNAVILGVGNVVNTGLMASNRCVATSISPITGFYGDSNFGGHFSYRMKSVGMEHIVITGKSPSHVYVYIDEDEEIHIKDAHDLWGKSTDVVTDELVRRHGASCEVACIGQGGENLIRYASVIVSKNHAAGRMGMGCVMGSKNLKAIVIAKGKRKQEIYNKELFDTIKKKWAKNAKASAISKFGGKYGTLFLVEMNNKKKGLPVRNFQQNSDEDAKELYPAVFLNKYTVKKEACISCPIGCSKAYEVKEGKFEGLKGSRMEYGAASLGPVLGIFDWPSVMHLKILCDKYGLDTIELGAAISLALEGKQRGILSKEDTFGRDIKFGDVDDAQFIIEKIVSREGIANDLAEGVHRAGESLGLQDYAFTINKSSTGLQTNKRLVRSLGYLTSTRGGDHLKSFAFSVQNGGYYMAKLIFGIEDAGKKLDDPEDTGKVLWWHENYKIVVDSIGVCLFAIQGLPSMGIGMFDDFADIMNSLYNADMTPKDIFYAAERIYQIQHMMNFACGQTIDDYVWPERKEESGIEKEYLSNTVISSRDAPGMLPEYFRYRGLTSKGEPSLRRFDDLDILNESAIEGFQLVEDKSIPTMEDMVKTVNLTLDLTLRDKIHIKFSTRMMDMAIKLKSKMENREFAKEELKKENEQKGQPSSKKPSATIKVREN